MTATEDLEWMKDKGKSGVKSNHLECSPNLGFDQAGQKEGRVFIVPTNSSS